FFASFEKVLTERAAAAQAAAQPDAGAPVTAPASNGPVPTAGSGGAIPGPVLWAGVAIVAVLVVWWLMR
ncbi:MAG: hypothetical protein ACOYLX_21845, partial [Burkholderiaceae bacterium]